MRRVFSGIQPTGVPHIGNYLGAIKNWIKIQNGQHNELVMFCVVDLHSTTSSAVDPKSRRENIFQMLASLLACGIDPKKSLVFQQSRVPHHTELAWFLQCLTSAGQLNRMHTWKDKSSEERNLSNVGLFSYPVLMAADILLYKSTHVPVGDDQQQHLGLARDITLKFNNTYSQTFALPQPMFTQASRIMSLHNPNNKMSKSDTNVNSRIDIIDPPDVICRKIRKAITDSEPYIGDLDSRPGVANLVSMYSVFSGLTVQEIVDKYQDVQYFTKPLKEELSHLLVHHLKPIGERYNELIDDRDYLEGILCEGSEEATKIAAQTMEEVYVKAGMR